MLPKVLKGVEGQDHLCVLEENTGVAETHTPGNDSGEPC